MEKRFNICSVNFRQKGMVSVNKWKLVRFQSLHTRNSNKKFGCLTKHDCVVNFVNVFIEWAYFLYGIQRDHILCYFDKQGLVLEFFGICPCLGMEFVMNAIINKYSAVSSYLTVSNGLLENQWRIYVLLSLETEPSKFWSVKYTKIRRKRWHSVFFKKLFIILYFSVKIASLTRFTNGFMNCSPTIIDLYLQLPLLFTFRNI